MSDNQPACHVRRVIVGAVASGDGATDPRTDVPLTAEGPNTADRPLLGRLYPDVTGLSDTGSPFLRAFFRDGLTDTSARDYSHAIR